MPLLRSITRVHRDRVRVGRVVFVVMAVLTLAVGSVLAGHYWLSVW